MAYDNQIEKKVIQLNMPGPEKDEKLQQKQHNPYILSLFAFGLFGLFGFLVDSPREVGEGFVRILLSRSLLNTDYIEVGGIGATFLNVALTGAISAVLFFVSKSKPTGATLMAIWLTVSFGFFGKNLLNSLPIHMGAWLFARYKKEPFANYTLNAVLAATLSPIVSELIFMNWKGPLVDGAIGMAVGVLVGFILPVIASFTTRIHQGYLLYNIGFAGGFVAVLLVSIIGNMGIVLVRPTLWSEGNNLLLAPFLYLFFFLWMLLGLLDGNRMEKIRALSRLFDRTGRLPSDYYVRYGGTTYINMGLCGMLGLTVTLVLSAQLNGATIAGIMSMMAFGAYGKHLKNCIPLMAGAIIAATFNPPPPNEPGNIIPILFCTGLAPVCGRFGWVWGVAAGFLHLAIFNRVEGLCGGLNLYNNGFTAGLVVILLLPIILALKKNKRKYNPSSVHEYDHIDE